MRCDMNRWDVWIVLCLISDQLQECSSQYIRRSLPIPQFLPEEQECPSEGDRFITVVQVAWNVKSRALRTIPPEVMLTKSSIPQAGFGIKAKTFIPKFTWLGEYEGEIITKEEQMTHFAFQMPRNDHVEYYIDAYNPRTSNWLRWINCARTEKEENVWWFYCAGKVYFMSRKDIYPSQELLMYYGHEYAEFLGITYRMNEWED